MRSSSGSSESRRISANLVCNGTLSRSVLVTAVGLASTIQQQCCFFRRLKILPLNKLEPMLFNSNHNFSHIVSLHSKCAMHLGTTGITGLKMKKNFNKCLLSHKMKHKVHFNPYSQQIRLDRSNVLCFLPTRTEKQADRGPAFSRS